MSRNHFYKKFLRLIALFLKIFWQKMAKNDKKKVTFFRLYEVRTIAYRQKNRITAQKTG
jgi:hypothetical protein